VIDRSRGKEMHVIADNQSAHKGRPVTDFLAVHPKVHLHFTPTYSSWLNQVELWFSKIERDVIARGISTQIAPYRGVEICRSIAPYQYTISWYGPLAPAPSSTVEIFQESSFPPRTGSFCPSRCRIAKCFDAFPRTTQRKHDKTADAHLSFSCPSANPVGLVEAAAQMDRGSIPLW